MMPRASPKIPKEKEKRRNYVANPRYTLSCESFVLLRTFPSGSCWKTIAKFHLRRLSPGPSHLALCCFNAIVALPSCRLLCLPSHHVIFNGYHNYTGFICLLWLGEGKKPAADKVAVRWLFTCSHALPARCAKNNDSSEERERGKENGERRGTCGPS